MFFRVKLSESGYFGQYGKEHLKDFLREKERSNGLDGIGVLWKSVLGKATGLRHSMIE